jgi:hypothetical protein
VREWSNWAMRYLFLRYFGFKFFAFLLDDDVSAPTLTHSLICIQYKLIHLYSLLTASLTHSLTRHCSKVTE